MEDLGWAITITLATTEPFDDDAICDLLDELADHGGATSGGEGRYSATLSLDRPDLEPPAVLAAGIAVLAAAVERAGLPVGAIVQAEVMTYAEQDRWLAS